MIPIGKVKGMKVVGYSGDILNYSNLQLEDSTGKLYNVSAKGNRIIVKALNEKITVREE